MKASIKTAEHEKTRARLSVFRRNMVPIIYSTSHSCWENRPSRGLARGLRVIAPTFTHFTKDVSYAEHSPHFPEKLSQGRRSTKHVVKRVVQAEMMHDPSFKDRSQSLICFVSMQGSTQVFFPTSLSSENPLSHRVVNDQTRPIFSPLLLWGRLTQGARGGRCVASCAGVGTL